MEMALRKPNANETQLNEKVKSLAIEIWNNYYAPVYGKQDEPILAIYSHMVSYPLYLSAYAYGNIIEFQLEEHLKTRHFATEIDRMYKLGRLTPNQWMQEAVGSDLDIEPMLRASQGGIKQS
jgi:oligoendopeptidase F